MQSIGERLEEARKRKGISIREAAESTKIRGEYLHKFESNQFDIKLPEIYVRGFLRTYANYLRLPGEKIINDYNALGFNSDKPRSINREVYGRMDLSVSSTKPEKDGKEPESQVATAESPDNGGTRNPATFSPRPSLNLPMMDRGLMVKGSAAAAGVVVLILILIWIFSGRGGDRARVEAQPPTSTQIWKKPNPGDSSFALVALGRVTVSVTYFDGTVFFQGTIPAGEIREIPRPGQPIHVKADAPEYLKIRIEGNDWPMRDPASNKLMNEMVIDRKK